MNTQAFEFYILEKYFTSQRENAKDYYWNSYDITVNDYKDIVDQLPISFNGYQEGVGWTAKKNPNSLPADVYMALGLAGESGELVDLIKKKYRSGLSSSEIRSKVLDEAADVLYYLAGLLDAFNIELEEVASYGQTKSVQRYKERFLKDEKKNNI